MVSSDHHSGSWPLRTPSASMALGRTIEALGSAPGGDGRVWLRAKVVALRACYPPLHVKFTATLEGVTHRLALPEPVTAYVNADGVRRIAN